MALLLGVCFFLYCFNLLTSCNKPVKLTTCKYKSVVFWLCTETNVFVCSDFICYFSCHNHSNSPPCLKIAIAGTEGYIGVVLRPFVEQFLSKPTWQNYVRFLVIPLGAYSEGRGGL